ncbi:MAG: hypothetical protein JKY15_01020 [Deltaproteobacteria bacterium]|nr:hypothetical protein [Deltaproteobacteria bacterium]
MIRVLISDKLSPEAIKLLQDSPEFEVDVGQDFLRQIEVYDALLIRSQTKANAQLISKASKLKMIGRAGVGLDNVDQEAAKSRSIEVFNTPQGNLVSTAEHTIALLMALVRHIPQATTSMKQGKWEKSEFVGTELRDKTLGVIGLGRVGQIVADLAKGLRMKVIAHDPVVKSPLNVPLKELYAESDFITIHVPLTAQTQNLVANKAFEQMKDGVKLLHAARGGIVDEAALLQALKSGKVSGAALDVFKEEPPLEGDQLVSHPNVICTPHLAASTHEAQKKVGLELIERTKSFFSVI